MVKKINLFIVLLTLSLLSFAGIEVSSNKKSLANTDTLTLNVSLKNIDKNKLNLKVLDKNWIIIDRSEQQSLMIINGQKTSSHLLQLVLKPKNIGLLNVPSFVIGKEKSKSFFVKVTDANKDKINQPLFIESSVDKKEVLVQSQLIYTINLYSIQPLNASNLPFNVNVQNSFVEKLKISAIKPVKYKGKSLYLTKFNYAIFPQKRGPLHIPEINFNVSLNNKGKINNIKLFGNAKNIKVKPQPNNINMSQWIAAKSIKLSAKYLKKPVIFKVGEPIIRQITITGKGISQAQLPEIPLTNVEAFQQYLDKKSYKKTLYQTSITSKKIQEMIIIPNYMGEFILPKIKIDWFNTQKNKKETAILPAQKIQVIAPKGYIRKYKNTTNITPKSPVNIKTNRLETKIIYKSDPTWQWISLLFLLLWLTTMVICKNKKNTKPKKAKINNKTPNFHKEIKKYCYQNNASKTRQTIIHWAKETLDDNINGLEGLIKNNHFQTIKEELLTLDKLLYQNNQETWDGRKFWKLISPLLKIETIEKQNDKLEPLYP